MKKDGKRVPELRFSEFEGEWSGDNINSLVKKKVLDKPLDGNHGNIHPKSSDYVPSGIPFIMANDISDGQVHLGIAKHIRKEQADRLQKGFAITGDVLLTHKGSIGLTAVVPELATEYLMLTPQVTYYRVLKRDVLDNKFLRFYFDTPIFQKDMKILSDSGTSAYLTK